MADIKSILSGLYPKLNVSAYVIVIAIILYIVLLATCNQNKYSKSLSKIDSLTLANQRLDSIRNDQGRKIYAQAALITNNQQDIKILTDSVFNLTKNQEKNIKNVIAYYASRTNTGVRNILVPYSDTIAMRDYKAGVDSECLDLLKFMLDSMITVPRDVALESDYFKFNGTILHDEFLINDISFVDSQYVRFEEIKGGFLRKVGDPATGKKKLKFHVPRSIAVKSFHTNPNVEMKGQSTVYYSPNTKKGIAIKIALVVAAFIAGLQL